MRDRWLNPREAAEILRVSRWYVYDLLRDDILPHVRLSPRVIRIKESDVVQLLEQRRQHANS